MKLKNNSKMRPLVTVLTVGVLVLFGVGLWQAVDFLLLPPGDSSNKVVFEVKPGTPFQRVASQLSDQGLIKSRLYFRVLARSLGYTQDVRVGEYELDASMTPLEILFILSSGKSLARPFTVQEGINMYEIAARFEAEGFGTRESFLRAATQQPLIEELLGEELESFEGYLYPETYHLTKYTTAEHLVRLMVQNFLNAYKEVEPKNNYEFTRHEVVTLASIIEKETGAPEERPLIASVFHNRLNKGMRLQSDPTIIYGIVDNTGKMIKNIRKSDIKKYTPYNTYRINGLPPGPISNPGKEALLATVQPENSDYFYFVSRNDGTHTFSKTFKEHQNAVNKWQKTRKNREGRSWRDRLNE